MFVLDLLKADEWIFPRVGSLKLIRLLPRALHSDNYFFNFPITRQLPELRGRHERNVTYFNSVSKFLLKYELINMLNEIEICVLTRRSIVNENTPL